jgi:uncharacterized protein (TIGR04141 family)
MPNLTIYLLREEYKTPTSALEGAVAEYRIESEEKYYGTIFIQKRNSNKPKWTALFDDFADTSLFGKVRSTSALYVTQSGGRLFAIAFGQGRHLIKPGAYEDRFGLLVVINALKSNQLRSVDKRTFDTVDQNVRAQVSQNSAATEFGIDIEKDLIRGITGYPEDPKFGARITGADSLVASVDVTIPKLSELLEMYLAAFQSDAYKKDFGWVDQIHQVGDRNPLKEMLDNKLLEKMAEAKSNEGRAQGLWLAIPDVVDYTGIHRFRFTGDTDNHNDLHLPGFIASLNKGDEITVDLLKRRCAIAVDDDGYDIGTKWPVYKCIHFEVEDGEKTYLLATGKWFSIRKKFSDEINDFYKMVPTCNLGWISYKHETEKKYNEEVCSGSSGVYALMDQEFIFVGGIRAKMEFCDIYSSSKEIIHVKRYGGSSLLGHLFNQGLISGEHLRLDDEFLKKLNAKLPASHRLDIENKTPRNVKPFKIIFAIVSEDQKEGLHIPFFAKVAFKNVCTRLKGLGYTDISKAKIVVDEIFSRTEKSKNKLTRDEKKAKKQNNLENQDKHLKEVKPAPIAATKKTVFKKQGDVA